MAIVFLAGGLIFGGYYLGLITFAGIGTSFAIFWLAASLLCWLGFAYIKVGKRFPGRFRLPLFIKVFLATSLVLGLALFAVVESRIIGDMIQSEPAEEPEYVIVLGAQVRGTQLSKPLRQRLDTALAYWQEHRDVVIIVSGGQGPGEDIAEAQAMYNYLMDAGVTRGKVVREVESRSTVENLSNSLGILKYREGAVAIVTSNYHQHRAIQIAETMTDRPISGLPAPTDPLFLPNYMVREFFAVLKDWFFGNI